MSKLPTPITYEGPRTLDKVGYKKKILEDEQMKNVESLINFGDTIFNQIDNLVDLTDINSIRADSHKIALPAKFIPLEQNATDFYSSAKPHNGLRSLRRGFYQLLPTPELIPVLDVKVWSMNVLFCEGSSNNTIYKYKCNVGPLVNKFAVCRDLTNKTLWLPFSKNNKQTLSKLTERVIYVSSAELVQVNETFKPYETKEVLWFVW